MRKRLIFCTVAVLSVGASGAVRNASPGRPSTSPQIRNSGQIVEAFLKAAVTGDAATSSALFDFESQVWMDQAKVAVDMLSKYDQRNSLYYLSESFLKEGRHIKAIEQSLSATNREPERRKRAKRMVDLVTQGKCIIGSLSGGVHIRSRWTHPQDANQQQDQDMLFSARWLKTIESIDMIPTQCSEELTILHANSLPDHIVALVVITLKTDGTPRVLDVLPSFVPKSLDLLIEVLGPSKEELAILGALISTGGE